MLINHLIKGLLIRTGTSCKFAHPSYTKICSYIINILKKDNRIFDAPFFLLKNKFYARKSTSVIRDGYSEKIIKKQEKELHKNYA